MPLNQNSQFLAANREEFVRKVTPYAQEAAKTLGVDPSVLVAQAGLETGWGQHVPKNNLFGIKAGGRYKGPSTNAATTEYRNGVAGTERANFRAYKTPADSFNALAALLKGNERYAAAVGTGNDASAYGTALQGGGYATDPNYATKLSSVADRVNAISGALQQDEFADIGTPVASPAANVDEFADIGTPVDAPVAAPASPSAPVAGDDEFADIGKPLGFSDPLAVVSPFAKPPAPKPPSMMDDIVTSLSSAFGVPKVGQNINEAFDVDTHAAKQQIIDDQLKAENHRVALSMLIPQAIIQSQMEGIEIAKNPDVVGYLQETGGSMEDFLREAQHYQTLQPQQLKQVYERGLSEMKRLQNPAAVPDDTWGQTFDKWPTMVAGKAKGWMAGIKGQFTDAHERTNRLWEARRAIADNVEKDFREKGIIPEENPAVLAAAKQFAMGPREFSQGLRDYTTERLPPDREAEVRATIAADDAKQPGREADVNALSARTQLLERASNVNTSSFWDPKNLATQAASSLVDMAPGAALSLAGAPELGLPLMFGQVQPQTYEKSRREHTPEQASIESNLTGLAEVAGEMPLVSILTHSPAGKAILKKLVGKYAETMGGKAVGTGITEGIGEMFTQTLEMGIAKGLYDKNVTVREAFEQLIQAGALGGIVGAPFGVAAHIGEKSQQQAQEDAKARVKAKAEDSALMDTILGRTQYGARIEPDTQNLQNVDQVARAPGTMQPPASTGSPPPGVDDGTGLAPRPASSQGSAIPTPPPPPTTPPSTDAQPKSVAPATQPEQKTEVPSAPPAPPVSTPTPTPHVETVEQPGEVKAGGTTAPASQTPVSKGETAPAPTPEKESAATPASPQTPPAAFREEDDEIEDVRKLFGLPPPPPEPEFGQKKAKDVAVQVFNQIKTDNPKSKVLLEKRIAALPLEARQKVIEWQDARTKRAKDIATRIADHKEGLERFAKTGGWGQLGGGIYRDAKDKDHMGNVDPQSGPVVGRLGWLAKAPWFKKVQGDVMEADGRTKRKERDRADLPGNNGGAASVEAVRKALAGEPLNTKQRRHINKMLDVLDEERVEAEKAGIDDYDPFAANEAVAKTAPAEETTITAVDTGLLSEAKRIDPEAAERAMVKWEESDDTAGFMAEIKGIIAAHDQSGHTTPNQGVEDVRPTEGRGEEAQSVDDFWNEQIAESAAQTAAKPAAPKVAAQGELLPKDQTKQDLADHERKQDEKRSPNKDVPADTGGGLFSNENKQTDIADKVGEDAETYDEVSELDDDIGTTAAEGAFEPEASLPEEAATAEPADRTTLPSTIREKLMKALGIDPAMFRLKGGSEQFALARKAIMERYGFNAVSKHTSQNWRNATDHLLDAYAGLHNLAAVLRASPKVGSLFGKLRLHLQRNTKARGLFYPTSNTISIMDQSDVFAHEFGHAIDYNLMEEGGGTMTPGGLSAAIRNRKGTAMLPDTIGQAYADLMTAIYYDGAHIAQLIKQAEHQLEKASTPARQAQLQKRLDGLRSGAWRGHGGKTQFYQRAKNGPLSKYLTKPTELIARSFEAYISYKIQEQKALGFTGFLGRPDAMYSKETDAWMKRIYPQAAERAQIFAAWDNLIGQLTREGVYDTSEQVGVEESEVNLGMMDPAAQAKAAGMPLTPAIVKAKNLTDKAAKSWHKDEVKRRDTVRNNLNRLTEALKENTPDALRHLNALMRNLGGTPDSVMAFLEKRFPGIPVLREIRDLFSDAIIFGRNKPLGLYRSMQQREHALVNDVIKQLESVGIIPNMPKEWTSHMWDVMHGYKEPANEEERLQADVIRGQYDKLWKLRDKNGVSIGYTGAPYMNRITHSAVANNPKYAADVVKLREMEKEKLLEYYNKQLEKAASKEEEKQWNEKIKKTQAIDPVKDTNDQISRMKGAKWGGYITLGALNEDSAKQRIFGPLADEILKDWYIQDPAELLSVYAASTAKEMVYKERLGDDPNAAIDNMLLAAGRHLPEPYVALLRTSMEISLGIDQIGNPLAGSQVINAYASVAQIQMLGRASIPNMSEPFGNIAKTVRPGKALAAGMRAAMPLLRSKNKKARFAAADRFGLLCGTLVDSTRSITAQAQATGNDTAGKGLLAKISRSGYMFNLLTPITSAQERLLNRMGAELFYDAAESIRANDEHADISAQWLREHGIKDAKAFAQFMADPHVMEKLTLADTFKGHGRELAQGLNQYVKTGIQSPTPSTKLMIAARGKFGMIANLTSWMSTNFRNWTIYNKHKITAAFTGKYGDAHLTAKQRVTAMALPVGSAVITMYVSQAFFVVARMLLTNSDEWEERGEDFWDRFTSKETQMQIVQYWGLLGWFSNIVIDMTIGARSKRGIYATAAGPFYGPLVQDAERFIKYGIDKFKDPNNLNNNAERNASMASYHLLSMLATAGLLAILPQSKVSGQITGFLWSFFGTSPQASREFATAVSGPKKGEENEGTQLGDFEAQERRADKKEKEDDEEADDADAELESQYEER